MSLTSMPHRHPSSAKTPYASFPACRLRLIPECAIATVYGCYIPNRWMQRSHFFLTSSSSRVCGIAFRQSPSNHSMRFRGGSFLVTQHHPNNQANYANIANQKQNVLTQDFPSLAPGYMDKFNGQCCLVGSIQSRVMAALLLPVGFLNPLHGRMLRIFDLYPIWRRTRPVGSLTML
jgi:hypothetical protein